MASLVAEPLAAHWRVCAAPADKKLAERKLSKTLNRVLGLPENFVRCSRVFLPRESAAYRYVASLTDDLEALDEALARVGGPRGLGDGGWRDYI